MRTCSSRKQPGTVARCTRDAATPGMCLSERRIEGADLTFRFPRSWLAQWRDVADAMERLTAQMYGKRGKVERPRSVIATSVATKQSSSRAPRSKLGRFASLAMTVGGSGR